MYQYILLTFVFGSLNVGEGQVLMFGDCKQVETMRHFELEKFLGRWYQIARFPSWYEDDGDCSYKLIQRCARTIQFQHIYVKRGVRYVLHVNSSYAPGDEAVFNIRANNIDPIGIPLSIITTDYTNYAVVYGCKTNEELNLKYVIAWILSRDNFLEPDILDKAYREVNSLPSSSIVYLDTVKHDEKHCAYHWSAHVNAEYYINNTTEKLTEN